MGEVYEGRNEAGGVQAVGYHPNPSSLQTLKNAEKYQEVYEGTGMWLLQYVMSDIGNVTLAHWMCTTESKKPQKEGKESYIISRSPTYLPHTLLVMC